MSIEVIKMKRIETSGALRAFADVKVSFQDEEGNECWMELKGFKVMDGRNGLFCSLPSTQGKDQKWYPSVWFDDILKAKIQQAVVDKYEEDPGTQPEVQVEPGAEDEVPF